MSCISPYSMPLCTVLTKCPEPLGPTYAVQGPSTFAAIFSSIGATIFHPVGTARMGNDPKTSVLNAHNQVWDAPNVFVTDGACMTSSSCVNPSLTYMALTARAADFAVTLSRRP